MKTTVAIGAYIAGIIDTLGVPRKSIANHPFARRAGLGDLPTISKLLNGKLLFDERRLFNFGLAIGAASTELKLKPAR